MCTSSTTVALSKSSATSTLCGGEKDSFTKLIKERASMSVVMTDAAHGIEDPQEAFLRTINTRIAGGGRLAATAQPPRVVVDVREFRSSLPSLLHGRTMVIVPCMLTVGDYVLSPNMCVERKSISDLIGSLPQRPPLLASARPCSSTTSHPCCSSSSTRISASHSSRSRIFQEVWPASAPPMPGRMTCRASWSS